MVRKLTSEEELLWTRVMDGAESIACPATPAELPNKRVNVRDHSFRKTIDLHGMTLHDAYRKVQEYFDKAYDNREKTVIVITGRSGNIVEEFPCWANSHPKVKKIEMKSNKGSWKVWLEKTNIT